MIIDVAALTKYVRTLFEKIGSQPEEARLVAENLVAANLAGHDSHGIGMIPDYVTYARSGALQLNQHMRIIKDTGPVIIIDGNFGFGQVIGQEAMQLVIPRARAQGLLMLNLRRTHHLARIGAWAEQLAAAGLVSLHFVNVVGVRPRVAAFGGSLARLGTNPFCIGVPRPPLPPLVLDIATSRIALGKVRVARNKRESVAPGTLVDAQAQPTTDPNAMFDEPAGAILPFGEHKGFGLSVMCEVLAGALSDRETIVPANQIPNSIVNNMTSFIFNPDVFVENSTFTDELNELGEWIKAKTSFDQSADILMPGEKETLTRAERRGGIPVDPETWAGITAIGDALGLDGKIYS